VGSGKDTSKREGKEKKTRKVNPGMKGGVKCRSQKGKKLLLEKLEGESQVEKRKGTSGKQSIRNRGSKKRGGKPQKGRMLNGRQKKIPAGSGL